MNIRTPVLAASLLLACAGSAHAAFITVGGAFSGTFGVSHTLAIDDAEIIHISGSTSGANYEGDVETLNTGGNNLLLTLTNFHFTSNVAGSITLTVDIVENYALSTVSGWTGSHQFNGNMDFLAAGQMGSLSVTSSHESTNLPVLAQTEVAAGPGTVTLNRGQGPATSIGSVSDPYTIHTTYTMTLIAGGTGSPVSLILPNSGVDQASAAIPAPAGALTLLLGMGGAMKISRRRRA